MTRFRISSALFIALLCGLALAGPVSAHHSIQSQFDIHKTVSISGTVAKIEWINPHSYLTVNVKDANGKVQKWAFELGGPASIRRAGLSRAGAVSRPRPRLDPVMSVVVMPRACAPATASPRHRSTGGPEVPG